MKPVEFTARKLVPQPAIEVSEGIADVDGWDDYDGYGIVPGIEKAVYEKRTDEIKGSTIRVTNSDGSQHREDIIEWIAGKRIIMKIYDFPLPLRTMASHFLEFWDFEENENGETLITRRFQIFPTNVLTRPLVTQLASVLKKATIAHLDEMANKALEKK